MICARQLADKLPLKQPIFLDGAETRKVEHVAYYYVKSQTATEEEYESDINN